MNHFLGCFLIIFSMQSQNLKQKLESVFNENQLMGLSVILQQNNTVESFNFGYQNLENKTILNENTKFRIASISKIFTVLGVLKLVSEKKLDLNEDVAKYLDFDLKNPAFKTNKISIKMLLNHTSSIVDGEGYDAFLEQTYTNDEIPNIKEVCTINGKYFTQNMFLNHEPGTFFTYCNLNYGLLGTIIEKISKTRFDVFMENEILKPMQINSSFNIQNIKDIENIATLYRFKNEGWYATKDDFKSKKPKPFNLDSYIIGTNGVFFGPQGGLRVSAMDLKKLLNLISGKTQIPNFISAKLIKLLQKPTWIFNGKNGNTENGFYNIWSYGTQILSQKTKEITFKTNKFGRWIGHSGDAYGLISDAYFSEKENAQIIIIANGSKVAYPKTEKNGFYNLEQQIFNCLNYE